jgi:hypothetical protein
MKIHFVFSFVFALVPSFSASLAFADSPPMPGEVIQGEISDSAAAQILYDSIGGEETNFSKKIGALKGAEGKPITKGRVKVTGTSKNDIEIACATYYNRGHHAVCKLVETFK